MSKYYYVIIDGNGTEVNFYDETFPNAKNRAIQSAKQVDNSLVVYRAIAKDGTKTDTKIWF